MPEVWVEGQVLNFRKWKTLYFLTLRDPDVEMSLKFTLPAAALGAAAQNITDGTHLVIRAQPRFMQKSGELSMSGSAARLVGVGELLARLEQLKASLASEGLFAADRKVPLPFLPRRIGLICATQGDAEHDVLRNARERWPGVQFEIRRVTVQGPRAVPEVSAALEDLDQHPEVDVIIVARGGGSFEDLLPFSNETLIRVAAQVKTPLVSAIGHEQDTPLLDLVADLRASTPTDAAKRVVPDVVEEIQRIDQTRARARQVLTHRLEREQDRLGVGLLRLRTAAQGLLRRELAGVEQLTSQLRALSPLEILQRGYAVVDGPDGQLVRSADQVQAGAELTIKLAQGEIAAQVR